MFTLGSNWLFGKCIQLDRIKLDTPEPPLHSETLENRAVNSQHADHTTTNQTEPARPATLDELLEQWRKENPKKLDEALKKMIANPDFIKAENLQTGADLTIFASFVRVLMGSITLVRSSKKDSSHQNASPPLRVG